MWLLRVTVCSVMLLGTYTLAHAAVIYVALLHTSLPGTDVHKL